MPAMKPSTTTRARTSRWESRATTAGSSTARRPRAPASRCGPRGSEPLAVERGSGLIASPRLPRERQHLPAVDLDRPAIPAPHDLPAVVAGEPEQQLEL